MLPNLVSVVMDTGGPSVITTISGTFRTTFHNTKTITGTFAPCEHAKATKRVEVEEVSVPIVPTLLDCVKI
jgi:hypothetical protein